MAAGSSTSPSNETVSLKLPSGEMVDAVVPAGSSDEQVKQLMRTKHPEFFAGASAPQARLEANGNPPASPSPSPMLDKVKAGIGNIGHGMMSGLNAIAGPESPSIIGLGTQMYKHFTGQPNSLEGLPAKAAATFFGMGEGMPETEAAPAIARPKPQSEALSALPVKTPPQAEALGQIGLPAGEKLAMKRFEQSTPGNLGKIAKPEPTPSAKPVEVGPKKPSYVDHAFGKYVDKFDPKNAQHNEILHATYDDLATRANAAELEGRSDWSSKDFARSTLTHGKNASPVTQRVRAALLETK